MHLDTDKRFHHCSGRLQTIALKAKPFAEDTTAAAGAAGEKGWGKDVNAAKAKVEQSKELPEPSAAKPRARLGETQVMQLVNSDSEDDAADRQGEDETPAESDPDLLKDYPDNTTVSNPPK